MGQRCSKSSVLSATPGLLLKIPDNPFLPAASLPSSTFLTLHYRGFPLATPFSSAGWFSLFFHRLSISVPEGLSGSPVPFLSLGVSSTASASTGKSI